MTIFGDARGSFRAIELDAKNGRGITITTPGGDPVGSSSLVTSFSVSQYENFSIAQCLNGGVHMYTFGHDPQHSMFTVGVTSFLSSCEGSSAEDLANAVSVYSAGRVSESKSEASMSVGNASFFGYLIGQQIDVVDTQLNIVTTAYHFIALDAH